jgi:hypothetical protein
MQLFDCATWSESIFVASGPSNCVAGGVNLSFNYTEFVIEPTLAYCLASQLLK